MKKTKAFTLIELLVVISIIALLLSIMTPALSKARQMARQVVCTSNMHQWAIATQTYCMNNRDEFPARFTPNGTRRHNGLAYYYVNETPGFVSALQPRINLLETFVAPFIGDCRNADCPGNPKKVEPWDIQKINTRSSGIELVSGEYGLFVGYDKNLGYIAWGPGPDYNVDPDLSQNAFVPPFRSARAPSRMAVAGCFVMNYFHNNSQWQYYHHFTQDDIAPKGAPAAFNDGSAGFTRFEDMAVYQRYVNHPLPIQFWWPNPRK